MCDSCRCVKKQLEWDPNPETIATLSMHSSAVHQNSAFLNYSLREAIVIETYLLVTSTSLSISIYPLLAHPGPRRDRPGHTSQERSNEVHTGRVSDFGPQTWCLSQ